MKITKKKDHYDTYNVEVTMGELRVVQAGLKNVPGPLADEGGKAIDWYLKSLPAPGEDPDKFKEKEKEKKELEGAEVPGDMPPDDQMPPLSDLDAPPTFDADTDLPNPPGFDEVPA